MLSKNGNLLINWHGYIDGEKGMGTVILLNTLAKAGFSSKIAATSNLEDSRNLLIFAGNKTPFLRKFEINPSVSPTNLYNSDTHPILEKYNALANQSWRKNYILYYYSGH